MRKLKLTVNEEKTHICRIPDESFDFLGYTFGRCYSAKTGRAYISQRPSKQKIQAVCRRISEVTDRRMVLAGHGGASRTTQPHHGGLGELLLPRSRWQAVSDCHASCP